MLRVQDKLFKIKQCRVCRSRELVNILSLGDLYLSDFVSNNRRPHKFPLSLVLCRECNLLQLKNTTPNRYLYTSRYGYKSGINITMQNELRDIVKKTIQKLSKRNKIEKIVVVDIGANDGTLLKNYPKHFYKIGVEPVKKFAIECENHANVVVNNFFTFNNFRKKVKNKNADIVSAISCFYDMESPNTLVSDVKKILNKGGVFVIQQNYLVSMLKQNAFDNIVHEHLEYYSLLSLEYLLDKHGLEVFDIELNDVNGGSFRTFVCHKGSKIISKNVIDCRKYEKKLLLHRKKIYLDFADRVRKNSKKLKNAIKKIVESRKKVYVYGASTRGNTLLQFCKLDNKLLTAAVERNPEKWGRNIASVQIPIISEEQARKDKPDYMLVLPWFFRAEFLKREKNYLQKGGHFIFPLPNVEIV